MVERTDQSIVCHMCAVIRATVSEPLRNLAKGRQPKRERNTQSGISTARAMARDLRDGKMMAVVNQLVASNVIRTSLTIEFFPGWTGAKIFYPNSVSPLAPDMTDKR